MSVKDLSDKQLRSLAEKYSSRNKDFQKEVEIRSFANDSKKLITSIQKEIQELASDFNDYVPWRANQQIVNRIENICDQIRDLLLEQFPEEAEKLTWSLLNAAESVFGYADDSNGAIGHVFKCEVHTLWVDTWTRLPKEQQAKLPYVLFDAVVKNNGYSIFDQSFHEFSCLLGEAGLCQIENLLRKEIEITSETSFSGNLLKYALESVIILRGNIDEYIELKRSNSPLSAYDVLQISEKLIEAGRAYEALDWLKKEDISYRKDEYLRLKIKCFKLLSDSDNMNATLWELFQFAPSKEVLDEIIASSKEWSISEKAKVIACSHPNKYNALIFFSEMKDSCTLAQYVFNNIDSLDGDIYEVLKPIAQKLEKTHPLEASLLYRKLVASLISRAASKYYQIAVNYLSKLRLLELSVSDWKQLPDHTTYFNALQQEHARKYRLWEMVRELSLI